MKHTPEEAAAERIRRKEEATKLVKGYGPKGIRREHIDQKLQGVLNELVDKKILIRFKKKGRGGIFGKWVQVWLRYNYPPPPKPIGHYPLDYEQERILHAAGANKAQKQDCMVQWLRESGYEVPAGHTLKWDQHYKRINVFPPELVEA
jgi:hypothetical protein